MAASARRITHDLAANRCLVAPATMSDVYAVAANLRHGDAMEVAGLGLEPRTALRMAFRRAIFRRAAYVDGQVAAIWGLGGMMLSDEGAPWLMTTPAAERVPVSFVRIGRAQVADMLAQRRFLCNFVDASYTRACRFLEVMGFVLDPARPMGPHGLPFRRFWMER